jgi:hypothetical protein
MSCCGSSSNYDCNNPCSVTETNTAACESLPSTIENFIAHFFGSVIKTETGGVVTWSLPCDLAVGLTNNPRLPDEGLACYFLRLFDEGITGLVGPKGDTGSAGADGNNAYSVTTTGFNQPTVGSPTFSVKMSANPAIMVGSTVFIQGSGWHSVTAIGGDWTVFLTLLEGLSGVTGALAAGKVVTVSGPRGLTGATGGQGIQGVPGPAGDAGDEYTPTHGIIRGVGANHVMTLAASLVQFGGTEVEITLPQPGNYLVEYIVGVIMDSTAATLPPERLTFTVWNATTAAFVPGISEIVRCFEPDEEGQVKMRSIVTTSNPNETLQLYGQISVAGKADVIAARSSVSYVRLS